MPGKLLLALLLVASWNSGWAASQDYPTARQVLEQRLAELEARCQTTTASQQDLEAVVEGWLYHARLTGDTGSLRRAMQSAAHLHDGTGASCTLHARLALATHRPGDAADILNECPGSSRAPLETQALRAEIALYQGNYADAIRHNTELLNRHPLPEHFVRAAHLRGWGGSPQEAHALLEAAQKRYHNGNPHQESWFWLQRGIVALEQGDMERGRLLFERAVDAFPGWWLAQEHLAETLHALGDTQAASALYDQVIASTGAGEFLAARAMIAGVLGDESAAEALLSRARQDFEKRLQTLPEAVAGHAVDFYLEHGPRDKALALAQADHARRPFGASATLLARALLQHDRPGEALQVLQPHVERGWRTAEAHWTLAKVLEALGRQDEAMLNREAAQRLNPRIGD